MVRKLALVSLGNLSPQKYIFNNFWYRNLKYFRYLFFVRNISLTTFRSELIKKKTFVGSELALVNLENLSPQNARGTFVKFCFINPVRCPASALRAQKTVFPFKSLLTP